MTLRQLIGSFDYFWVFVPRYDAWYMCRLAGERQIPVIEKGGLWMIVPDKIEDFDAIGIEQPKHPRAVEISKKAGQ